MQPIPPPDENSGGGASLSARVGFWLGLAAFGSILLFLDLDPERRTVTHMAAVAALMAIWWVTEALPLPITALLPMALFAPLGIMKSADVAPVYIDSTIFVFIGGFIIALAMERWNLHRRIALLILRTLGGRPHMVALGFMFATGFVSMWISNTATAMMMIPMGISMVLLHDEMLAAQRAAGREPDRRASNFPFVILLTIAYGASIGGVATLIGTPTNLILASIFEKEFPGAPPITFARWAAFAFPLAVSMLVLSWALLAYVIYPLPRGGAWSAEEFIERESRQLGRLSREEKIVLVVFTITGLLWMFRADIKIGEEAGAFRIPGWSNLFGANKDLIDDGTVAIVMGLLLFFLPARGVADGRIMNWETAKKLPWGVLLVFGGGYALAAGLGKSGLSQWIGNQFVMLQGAPPTLVILGVSSATLGVTELASNMATAQMALPILASLARAIEVNPLMLMIPATISASLGFMMPMGTTTNMIVYGTERVPAIKMIRAGIFLNILGIILMLIFVKTLALPIFGISPGEFPEWARAIPAAAPPAP